MPLGQRSFTPRYFNTQQSHYTRFSVNFNSCIYVASVCSIKVGTVPYNAYLLRGYAQTTTAWNAGTSASIGLGTVTPGVNILASALTTTFTGPAVTLANSGVTVTGGGIVQTGTNGGFDVFATITLVGAAPTAGATQFILEWAASNDGSCAPVPLGATAAAC